MRNRAASTELGSARQIACDTIPAEFGQLVELDKQLRANGNAVRADLLSGRVLRAATAFGESVTAALGDYRKEVGGDGSKGTGKTLRKGDGPAAGRWGEYRARRGARFPMRSDLRHERG